MNIHHRVDFVLRIVDSLTERGVKGGINRFWLDGHPIKPTKVMDRFFIFSNIFSDPKKFHLFSSRDQGMLTWENPFYISVAMPIHLTIDRRVTPSEEILIRGLPSEYYPFSDIPTGLRGCIEGAEQVRLLHQFSRNRYHLKGPVIKEKYIDLAQSIERNLEGKRFKFGTLEPPRMILKDDFGTFVWPNFEQPIQEDCDILEVIEVPVDSKGQFFMVLSDVDGEGDMSDVALEIINGNQVKVYQVHLEKDQILDIGHLVFSTLNA